MDKRISNFDKCIVLKNAMWKFLRDLWKRLFVKRVTIGKGSVIGAGTLVTKDIPARSIVIDKK